MLRDVYLFVNSIGRMEWSDSPQQHESDGRQTTIEFFRSVGSEKRGEICKAFALIELKMFLLDIQCTLAYAQARPRAFSESFAFLRQ